MATGREEEVKPVTTECVGNMVSILGLVGFMAKGKDVSKHQLCLGPCAAVVKFGKQTKNIILELCPIGCFLHLNF